MQKWGMYGKELKRIGIFGKLKEMWLVELAECSGRELPAAPC